MPCKDGSTPLSRNGAPCTDWLSASRTICCGACSALLPASAGQCQVPYTSVPNGMSLKMSAALGQSASGSHTRPAALHLLAKQATHLSCGVNPAA